MPYGVRLKMIGSGAALAARREDLGVEPLAVAHRDHHVADLEAVGGARRLLQLRGRNAENEEADREDEDGKAPARFMGGRV